MDKTYFLVASVLLTSQFKAQTVQFIRKLLAFCLELTHTVTRYDD